MRCFSAVAELLYIIIFVVVGALGLFAVANKNNVAFPGAWWNRFSRFAGSVNRMSPGTGLVLIVLKLLHIKQTDLTSRAKEK